MVLIADRLAGAGGAGDQQVRHAGEVGDDRLAADVLAERQGEGAGMRSRILGEASRSRRIDRLALRVRQLDADDVAAGHHRDAHREALIERAMSSARPMTRDDLMPRRGSSS